MSTVLWQTEMLYTVQHRSLSCVFPGIGQCVRAWSLSTPALSTTRTLPCNTPLLLHSDRFVFLTDIFQRVFAADAKYLENHENMNQSFWESLVKCLATTDPPILNTEEKNNVSYQKNTYPCYSTFLLYSGEREHTVPLSGMLKYISRCNRALR